MRDRDWGATPADLFPEGELPLHRLGFAATERDAARGPLAEARAALLSSPFGFCHRDATAGKILLAPGRAWLTDFGRAGFGPQMFDVAAFLLTSGIEAAGRRALAASTTSMGSKPKGASMGKGSRARSRSESRVLASSLKS